MAKLVVIDLETYGFTKVETGSAEVPAFTSNGALIAIPYEDDADVWTTVETESGPATVLKLPWLRSQMGHKMHTDLLKYRVNLTGDAPGQSKVSADRLTEAKQFQANPGMDTSSLYYMTKEHAATGLPLMTMALTIIQQDRIERWINSHYEAALKQGAYNVGVATTVQGIVEAANVDWDAVAADAYATIPF